MWLMIDGEKRDQTTLKDNEKCQTYLNIEKVLFFFVLPQAETWSPPGQAAVPSA
jgi:hypothetical protein